MMRMPKITSCNATICAFNKDMNCHACAITVGNGGCPQCDTAMPSNEKGGDASDTGSVGACKSTQCKYNSSLECAASTIKVGMHGSHPDCMTFSQR